MKILVTGGAGFIGTNLVNRLLEAGHSVTIYDNLSRCGVDRNLEWLRSQWDATGRMKVLVGDIRNRDVLDGATIGVNVVYHLAAQVAVTTSVSDPLQDFEVNARGTLNVLEAARHADSDPIVVFTSTNKVYGGMDDVSVIEGDTRYEYLDQLYLHGVSENRPLDFHSPYGCSKGAADQYVRDYYRIYGLRTTVFRMSCIYGPHQFGNEDQGWVAHFVIAAQLGMPLTIYGNGKQVRDILFVDDLVRAFQLVPENPERSAGQIYNVGGGPANTLSVWVEFQGYLEGLTGKRLNPSLSNWRPGDQRIYVTDPAKIREDLGWSPKVTPENGIEQLYRWVHANERDISYVLDRSLAR